MHKKEMEDLFKEVERNIVCACMNSIESNNKALSEEGKRKIYASAQSSEAQAIVFNNIVSGDDFTEYFGYTIESSEVFIDENGIFKTIIRHQDHEYIHQPIQSLYDENNVEPEEIVKEAEYRSVKEDFVFSDNAKKMARDIVGILRSKNF